MNLIIKKKFQTYYFYKKIMLLVDKNHFQVHDQINKNESYKLLVHQNNNAIQIIIVIINLIAKQ